MSIRPGREVPFVKTDNGMSPVKLQIQPRTRVITARSDTLFAFSDQVWILTANCLGEPAAAAIRYESHNRSSKGLLVHLALVGRSYAVQNSSLTLEH